MKLGVLEVLEALKSEIFDDGALDQEQELEVPDDRANNRDLDAGAWSSDSVRAGIKAYFAFGSLLKAEAATGIPKSTIGYWLQDQRFSALVAQAKTDCGKHSGIKSAVIFRAALSEAADILINGEERLTPDGRIVKMRPGLRDVTGLMKASGDQGRAYAAYAEAPSSLGTSISHEAQAALEQRWLAIKEAELKQAEDQRLIDLVQSKGGGSPSHPPPKDWIEPICEKPASHEGVPSEVCSEVATGGPGEAQDKEHED